MMELLQQIVDNLKLGEENTVTNLVLQATKLNITPNNILDNALIKGMKIIGQQFKNHEIFLPDVLMAARAMQAGMEILKPLLIKDGIPSRAKIIIGTVQGDLHDIGKNLVTIMLQGAGFEVIDLGIDVAPEIFVKRAVNEKATVIGMSALLTTTMPVMAQVITLLKNQGLYDQIKVIVGGAPVSQSYAQQIGAHAYGFDGTHAVECIENIINENS